METKILGMEVNDLKKAYYLSIILALVYFFIPETALAVTVQTLQAPMRELKTDIFGGWMMAVKIVAAATGVIISTVRASLAPVCIGAGLSVGIHFLDSWLGDGSAGALI